MPDITTKPSIENEDDAVETSFVEMWTKRIRVDKDYWDKDFKRMRQNMEFVSGIQWEGQQSIRDSDERYCINLIIGIVNGLVAQLYARNPEAEATPRKRMIYEHWDGTIEQLMEAMQGYQMNRQVGAIVDPVGELIMQDFYRGKIIEEQVAKICESLQRTYQYFVDTTRPDFKEQMKQLVVRVITCGVGYCIPAFIRESRFSPSSVEPNNSIVDQLKMAKQLLNKIDDDKITESDPEMETLKDLMLSIGNHQEEGYVELSERLEFDFPPAPAIIPDRRCRNLREFIGARYVTHEMILPVEEINAFFGLEGDDRVTATNDLKTYSPDGTMLSNPNPNLERQEDHGRSPRGALWRVFDAQTKCQFFIVDGHKKLLVPPEPIKPCIAGFWPLMALTFNNLEVEEEARVSPFPPSIVDIVRDAQQEWNRTRDALRSQRNANAPTYLVRKGVLTEEDKEKIRNRQPNEVIELEGVPADMQPAQIIQALQVAQIDQKVYDTQPLEQDIQLGGGVQQANIGPAQPDVTATVGTIAEQSRLQLSSSNVDDLDVFLSHLARACGEMLLQEMSEASVKRIVGDGAVWPGPETKQDFLNMIDLSIKAASSGRPNQAMKVQMRQQLIPLLMQAGANPIAVIEELVKTMDDTLDVQKFFPIPGQAIQTAGAKMSAQQQQPQISQGPPQQTQQPSPMALPPQMPPNALPMPMSAA